MNLVVWLTKMSGGEIWEVNNERWHDEMELGYEIYLFECIIKTKWLMHSTSRKRDINYLTEKKFSAYCNM